MSEQYTASWLPKGAKESFVLLPGGEKLRIVELGAGKPLLLLHTLRTQLDYFQKLAPLIAKKYKVILLDLPGHGYSTTDPRALYDEPYFRKIVLEAIEVLGLKNFYIGGESIGASLALTVAASLPEDRVEHVFALNPYDYGERFGGGVRRSKNGWTIGLFGIFRQWTIEPGALLRQVLDGGFSTHHFEPQGLYQELVHTGHRRYYRRAEYELHAHWRNWLEARSLYKKVPCEVTLIYGEQDWSNAVDRLANKKLLPVMCFEKLSRTGHFSALESPDAVVELF